MAVCRDKVKNLQEINLVKPSFAPTFALRNLYDCSIVSILFSIRICIVCNII